MGAAQQRLSVPEADKEGGAGACRSVRDGAGCFGGNIDDTGRRSPRFFKVDPEAPDPPVTDYDDEWFRVRTVWMMQDVIRKDSTKR